jgi:hypothetical protein
MERTCRQFWFGSIECRTKHAAMYFFTKSFLVSGKVGPETNIAT